MLVRTETPDACDTCGDDRASLTTSSITSDINRGMSTRTPLALVPSKPLHPRVLLGDSNAFVDALRVVRADHAADADPSAASRCGPRFV
jgi:hypothetical protein